MVCFCCMSWVWFFYGVPTSSTPCPMPRCGYSMRYTLGSQWVLFFCSSPLQTPTYLRPGLWRLWLNWLSIQLVMTQSVEEKWRTAHMVKKNSGKYWPVGSLVLQTVTTSPKIIQSLGLQVFLKCSALKRNKRNQKEIYRPSWPPLSQIGHFQAWMLWYLSLKLQWHLPLSQVWRVHPPALINSAPWWASSWLPCQCD